MGSVGALLARYRDRHEDKDDREGQVNGPDGHAIKDYEAREGQLEKCPGYGEGGDNMPFYASLVFYILPPLQTVDSLSQQ
jgi:hypothetical protein